MFIVTSVVSLAFVLGIFASEGDHNPSVKIKPRWGVILAALGYVMILSGNIGAIKSIIALGSLPFVLVVLEHDPNISRESTPVGATVGNR